MNNCVNPPSAKPDDTRDPALLAIERDHPGWVAWLGVIPMYYARWLKSTPPVVVRSATIAGLRAEIEKAKAERRRPR